MADETDKTYTFPRQPLGVRAAVVTVAVVVLLLLAGRSSGSELPDRECCDSAPPPPPHYHTVTSTTTSTTPQPPGYGKHHVTHTFLITAPVLMCPPCFICFLFASSSAFHRGFQGEKISHKVCCVH